MNTYLNYAIFAQHSSYSLPGGIDGDKVGQLAIISRCNYTLFNEAVQVCCAPENHDQRVGFAGVCTINGNFVVVVEDILFIHSFPNFRDLFIAPT